MRMFSPVSIIKFSSAAIADLHQRLGVNEKWQQHCHPFSSRLSLTIYRFAIAANTGRKKVAKNRHLGTIAHLRRAIPSQLRHVSTIGKKTC